MKKIEEITFGFRQGTKSEYKELLKKVSSLLAEFQESYSSGLKKSLYLQLFELIFWEGNRDKKMLHPSEISYGYCKRMAFLKLLHIPQDEGYINAVDNGLMKIFNYGTLVHFYIQYNLMKIGFISDFEVAFKDSYLNIIGSADGVGEDFVLEIKTTNPYTFNKLKSPIPEHLKQASLYAHFLGKEYILFLYIDKSSLKIKEYKVRYDNAYIDSVIRELKALRELKKEQYGMKVAIPKSALRYGTLPERECKSRLSEKAMKCPFANTCFKK